MNCHQTRRLARIQEAQAAYEAMLWQIFKEVQKERQQEKENQEKRKKN
jgi:hypothetical protein